MYFSMSLGFRRQFSSTRASCWSSERTRGGRSPLKPRASRSFSVNAVPLFSGGSCKRATPFGTVTLPRELPCGEDPGVLDALRWALPVGRLVGTGGRCALSACDLIGRQPPRRICAGYGSYFQPQDWHATFISKRRWMPTKG